MIYALLATVCLMILIIAYALARMAGPANELELSASDDDQIKFINDYMAKRLERTKPN